MEINILNCGVKQEERKFVRHIDRMNDDTRMLRGKKGKKKTERTQRNME